ncbi:hypothetical protein ES708_31040 [subsurface metagenome]
MNPPELVAPVLGKFHDHVIVLILLGNDSSWLAAVAVQELGQAAVLLVPALGGFPAHDLRGGLQGFPILNFRGEVHQEPGVLQSVPGIEVAAQHFVVGGLVILFHRLEQHLPILFDKDGQSLLHRIPGDLLQPFGGRMIEETRDVRHGLAVGLEPRWFVVGKGLEITAGQSLPDRVEEF